MNIKKKIYFLCFILLVMSLGCEKGCDKDSPTEPENRTYISIDNQY